MKKSTFVLALLMVFGSVAMAQHQANPQQILKSISKQLHGERWIEIFSPQYVVVDDEVSSTRYYYEYDEDYMLTTLETQHMENGAWTPFTVSTYDYDFNYNVIEIFTKYADNEEEISLETFTYEGGVISEDVYQEWDGSDWVNDYKLVYNFNDDVTAVLLWDWDGDNWAPSYLYTYTKGSNTEELLIQYMQGGAWQNEEKQTRTYNDEGALTDILTEFFVNNVWEQAYLTNYHYTNGLFDRVVKSALNGDQIVEVSKCEYTYDNHGNAISGESFCYDNGWQNCSGVLEMAYDSNYDVIEYEGVRFSATFIDVTSVGEETVADNFTFYPNPVKNVLVVRAEDFQKAEVYSLTGAKLKETTLNRVDVSELQSGMYLLKVYGKETGCQARVFVVK